LIVTTRKGRKKSVITKEELAAHAGDMVDALTDAELELVMGLIDEDPEIQIEHHKTMRGHLYHREPVSMEQFIEDPHYLGESCSTLYPELKKDLIDLFDYPFREVVLTGGIGVGKCQRGVNELYDPVMGRRLTVEDAASFGKYKACATFNKDERKTVSGGCKVFESGRKKAGDLVLGSGKKIGLTPDHPVLTPWGYKPVGELKKGDLVATSREMPLPEMPLAISDNEVKWVGYILADGGVTTSRIVFVKGVDEIISEFWSLSESLGGDVKEEDVDADARRVRVLGLDRLRDKFDLKHKSKDKRVPSEFYGLDNRQLALLLNRIWSCDGWFCRRDKKKGNWEIGISLASEPFVRDIQQLLLRFGIHSRMRPREMGYTHNGERKHSDAWSLQVLGRDEVIRFLNSIGNLVGKEEDCETARRELEFVKGNSNVDITPMNREVMTRVRKEIGPVPKKAYWPRPAQGSQMGHGVFLRFAEAYDLPEWCSWWGGVFWDEVESYECGDELEPVYDIEVPKTRNFSVHGVIVHNTFVLSIAICRVLYELSCLVNPQKTFGLSSGTEMVIPLISKNLPLARAVMKTAVDDKIKESPYFMNEFSPKISKEATLFPHNIRVIIGSYGSERVLGSNVFCVGLDECLILEAGLTTERKGVRRSMTVGDLLEMSPEDAENCKVVGFDHAENKLKAGWWRIKKSTVQELVEIRTALGSVSPSRKHPVLVQRGDWLVYVHAEDVVPGDFVVMEDRDASEGADCKRRAEEKTIGEDEGSRVIGGDEREDEICAKGAVREWVRQSDEGEDSVRGDEEENQRGPKGEEVLRGTSAEDRRGESQKEDLERDAGANERGSKEQGTCKRGAQTEDKRSQYRQEAYGRSSCEHEQGSEGSRPVRGSQKEAVRGGQEAHRRGESLLRKDSLRGGAEEDERGSGGCTAEASLRRDKEKDERVSKGAQVFRGDEGEDEKCCEASCSRSRVAKEDERVVEEGLGRGHHWPEHATPARRGEPFLREEAHGGNEGASERGCKGERTSRAYGGVEGCDFRGEHAGYQGRDEDVQVPCDVSGWWGCALPDRGGEETSRSSLFSGRGCFCCRRRQDAVCGVRFQRPIQDNGCGLHGNSKRRSNHYRRREGAGVAIRREREGSVSCYMGALQGVRVRHDYIIQPCKGPRSVSRSICDTGICGDGETGVCSHVTAFGQSCHWGCGKANGLWASREKSSWRRQKVSVQHCVSGRGDRQLQDKEQPACSRSSLLSERGCFCCRRRQDECYLSQGEWRGAPDGCRLHGYSQRRTYYFCECREQHVCREQGPLSSYECNVGPLQGCRLQFHDGICRCVRGSKCVGGSVCHGCVCRARHGHRGDSTRINGRCQSSCVDGGVSEREHDPLRDREGDEAGGVPMSARGRGVHFLNKEGVRGEVRVRGAGAKGCGGLYCSHAGRERGGCLFHTWDKREERIIKECAHGYVGSLQRDGHEHVASPQGSEESRSVPWSVRDAGVRGWVYARRCQEECAHRQKAKGKETISVEGQETWSSQENDELEFAGIRPERTHVEEIPVGLCLAEVVSVSALPAEQTYSLCTEHQTFIADGFVVHNTNFPPNRKSQQITTAMGQKKTKAHFDIVEKVYRNLVRRIKSRFQVAGGDFPGMIILASSAATLDSFTERKIRESRLDSSVFVRDHTQWTAKPGSNFCGEKFWVLCSASSMRSRIIGDDEVKHFTDEWLEENDSFLIDIPVEYKSDFETDIENALRDLAGISTQAISIYIQRPDAVDACVSEEMEHPFTAYEWTSGQAGAFKWNILCNMFERRLPGGYTETAWSPKINPSKMRWCHIDTSLSGDCTGFCVGHIDKWVEVVRRDGDGVRYTDLAPSYVIDVMLRVNPPAGEQIYMPDLRRFIYELQAHGYQFLGFSSDTYQSAEMHQQVKRRGISTHIISTDTSTDPYDELKMAMYENRITYYHYQPFIEEIKDLEYDRNVGKIDHQQAGCFVGETRIPLLDGSCPMISELDGVDTWVYSCTEGGRIVPGRARGRLTKEVTELVDVVLDSGAVERCTHEHLWMLRDGTYKKACDLDPGIDRLMPIDLNSFPVEHKVRHVTPVRLDKPVAVYDLEVEEYSNFSLSSGVFVHNSKDVSDAVAGVVYGLMKTSTKIPAIVGDSKSAAVENEYDWVSPMIQTDGISAEELRDMKDAGDTDVSEYVPIVFGD